MTRRPRAVEPVKTTNAYRCGDSRRTRSMQKCSNFDVRLLWNFAKFHSSSVQKNNSESKSRGAFIHARDIGSTHYPENCVDLSVRALSSETAFSIVCNLHCRFAFIAKYRDRCTIGFIAPERQCAIIVFTSRLFRFQCNFIYITRSEQPERSLKINNGIRINRLEKNAMGNCTV